MKLVEIVSLLKADYIRSNLFPYVIGLLFATVVGHFPIALLVKRLWLTIGRTEQEYKRNSWLPMIVGCVERALYVVASIKNDKAPEIIGAWLVLKAASNWSAWKNGLPKDRLLRNDRTEDNHISGGSIFDIFMIGNGMSIGYALVGSYLICECRKNVPNVAHLILVPLVLLAATVWLWLITKKHREK